MSKISGKSVVLELFFDILAYRNVSECHQWFSNCFKPLIFRRKAF